jgi:hypothetical protein
VIVLPEYSYFLFDSNELKNGREASTATAPRTDEKAGKIILLPIATRKKMTDEKKKVIPLANEVLCLIVSLYVREAT